MAGVLIATLYAASAPVYACNGAGVVCQNATAAQLKDGSDATYAYALHVSGGTGSHDEDWTLDDYTHPAGYKIDYLRVRIRAYKTGSGTSQTQPRISSTLRGTPAALTGSAAWYPFDFTTDPADGLPWTEAKIDAQKWGFRGAIVTNPGAEAPIVTEFRVEVWGHIAVTPARATMTTTAQAPTTVNVRRLRPNPQPNPANLTLQEAARNGFRSLGQPYFAMRQEADGNNGVFAGEVDIWIDFALHATPPQAVSPSEPHWLFSHHDTLQGEELLSVGFTPNLAVVGAIGAETNPSVRYPLFLSDPGLAIPDSVARRLHVFVTGSSFLVEIEGLEIFRVQPERFVRAYSGPLPGGRVQWFNGWDMKSRLDATVYRLELVNENTIIIWPKVGSDVTPTRVDGAEHVWTGSEYALRVTPEPDLPTIDFDVVAGFFPPPDGTRPWGRLPPSAPIYGGREARRGFFRSRTSKFTGHSRLDPSNVDYSAGTAVSPTYRRKE